MLASITLLLALPCVLGGAPIPARPGDVGWQMGTAGAPMSIEIFGDFQCPDTKAAWEGVLKELVQRRAANASIIFHPFPLPYHKNGFDAAQAAYAMVDLLAAQQGGSSSSSSSSSSAAPGSCCTIPCASGTHGDCQLPGPTVCSKDNPGGCFCENRQANGTCPENYVACCPAPPPTPPTPTPPTPPTLPTPPPSPGPDPWGPTPPPTPAPPAPTPPVPPAPTADSFFPRVGDALFAAQASFQTDATVNVTQRELFERILAPVAQAVGVGSEAAFVARMTNADPTNDVARVGWKFGAARGVSGTPTFAANGVISDDLASWTLDMWMEWLDAGGR